MRKFKLGCSENRYHNRKDKYGWTEVAIAVRYKSTEYAILIRTIGQDNIELCS